jgi:hypothetical protein
MKRIKMESESIYDLSEDYCRPITKGYKGLWGSIFWYFIHCSVWHLKNWPMKEEQRKNKLERLKVFYCILPYLLPCSNCGIHSKELIDKNSPIDCEGVEDLAKWTVSFHNGINNILEKKEKTYEEVNYFFSKNKLGVLNHKKLYDFIFLIIQGQKKTKSKFQIFFKEFFLLLPYIFPCEVCCENFFLKGELNHLSEDDKTSLSFSHFPHTKHSLIYKLTGWENGEGSIFTKIYFRHNFEFTVENLLGGKQTIFKYIPVNIEKTYSLLLEIESKSNIFFKIFSDEKELILNEKKTQEPCDRKTQEPRDRKTQEPRDRKTQEPRDRKTQEPRDRKTQEPRDRKTHEPCDRKTHEPRDRKTQEPCDRKTHEPCDRKTHEPCDRKTHEPCEKGKEEVGDRKTHEPCDKGKEEVGDRKTHEPCEKGKEEVGDRKTHEPCDKGTEEVGDRKTHEPCDKGTEEVCEKGTEEVCEKGTEEVCEKGTEEVCDKGKEEVCDKGTEEVCDKGTEEVCEKGTEEVCEKRMHEVNGLKKYYFRTELNDMLKIELFFSEKSHIGESFSLLKCSVYYEKDI